MCAGSWVRWVATCAGFANLLSGFRVYAAVLAGYTGSLVALVALHHRKRGLNALLPKAVQMSRIA